MARLPNGQFPPRTSGNPRGRPLKARVDSAASPAAPPPTLTRRDGWQNEASGHGTRRDRRTLTRFGVDIVTDIEALQLWRSEFLAATIIEGEPAEALKRSWRFKCEDRDLEVAIVKQAEELGLDGSILKAAEYENAYGGSAIFPVLSGALGDLSQPLDSGGIASVDAFHVFEPQELLPDRYYGDVRLPKFRRPETYRLVPLTNGRSGFLPPQIIHESRLIIFPGLRVSEQTQPGQRPGWGDSILCRPRQVIADFGLSWGSAATLLHEHGKGTLKMDGFANMMAQADGLAQFDQYITAMSMAWTTLGMVVVDSKSDYTRSVGTLSGISDVLKEFKSLMAAACGRPVSKLFGDSQSGLRTGEDDTLSWEAKVESYQSKHLKPRHEQAVKLLLLATSGPTSGKEPEAWSVEYPPLRTPSAKEESEIQLADMQKAQIAVNVGIASADDVADSYYKGDKYSGEIKINWERREAQAATAQQSPGDLSPEDQAALDPGEQPDLSDDEQQQLDALQREFGTEDGGGDEEPVEVEADDEEPDPGDDDERDDSADDEWRDDQVGVSATGHGYNPYRANNGQFGAGAHKAKPTAGERHAAAMGKATERVGKTKARVEGIAGKLEAAHAGRHAALAETRSALAKAQTAGELARATPTAKNIKAAQVATNKATRAQAKVGKHEAAIAKHTDGHAKATTAHAKAVEAHAKVSARGAEAKSVAKTREAKPEPTKPETPQKAPKPEPPKAAAKEPTAKAPDATVQGGLAATKINSLKPLSGDSAGVNSSYVATLSDGGKAVFKPASGESAMGVTAPLRTNIDGGTYYKRETAAYKLAEQMGLKDMIPETATVTHNGEVGSLQRWRPGGKLVSLPGEPNGSLEGGARFSHEDSERMRVFDFVTGNSDRHAGNLLVDSSSGSPRPILIDHGLTFPKGPPDRFIQPTDAMHESRDLHPNTEKMIGNMNVKDMAKTLKESGIEREAIRHTLIRVKALKSDPSIIATPWASPAFDAWNMYTSEAHRMVSKSDMKEIDDVLAGR